MLQCPAVEGGQMFGAGTLGWQRSEAVDEFTGCAVRFFSAPHRRAGCETFGSNARNLSIACHLTNRDLTLFQSAVRFARLIGECVYTIAQSPPACHATPVTAD